ncbi:MAG: hypothetical protein AB7K09_03725 [Planctomycetota bacterium]
MFTRDRAPSICGASSAFTLPLVAAGRPMTNRAPRLLLARQFKACCLPEALQPLMKNRLAYWIDRRGDGTWRAFDSDRSQTRPVTTPEKDRPATHRMSPAGRSINRSIAFAVNSNPRADQK